MADKLRPGTLRFHTNCVSAKGADIRAMVDTSKQITRRTFRRYLTPGAWEELSDALGYDRNARDGLTLANDQYVGYYRGIYRKQPCVYLVWSAIEYIFCSGPAAD